MAAQKNIVQKLSTIMAELPAIAKKMQPQSSVRYAFRTIDDVVDAVNQALSDNGIMIQTKIISQSIDTQVVKDRNGKDRLFYYASTHREYTFTDGNGIVTTEEQAGAGDYSDKAEVQAGTMAYKYMLIRFFNIKSQESQDSDGDAKNPLEDTTANGQTPTSKASQNGKPITAAQLQKGKNDILRSMAASGLNASDLEKDLLMQAEGTDYTHLAQDAKDYLKKIEKEERAKKKKNATS